LLNLLGEFEMRCLITTSRMPFALDEVRKLGRTGHTVFASDTFRSAPGGRTRFAAESFVTPSPRFDSNGFVARVSELVRQHGIELVLPAFEEALTLSEHAGILPARLFAPRFETLRMLHHKHAFIEFARKLGLPTPMTTVARSDAELRSAVAKSPGFFARPVNSRGGIDLLTDTGPLAGAMPIGDCHPTPEHPWIVQPFVSGVDVCTFSVVHQGRLSAHVSYVHPREIEHAGGIVFESVREPETLAIAQRIAEESGYEGQLSLDLRLGRDGFVLIECNPRPTAGVFMLTDEEFERAVMAPPPREPFVAPPGRTRKFTFALLRDMALHWREIPRDLPHLLSAAPDVYAERGDWAPALFQLLSYGQVLRYRVPRGERHRPRTRLMSAYFHDVAYDGPLFTSAA
jgi:hypothetical protein